MFTRLMPRVPGYKNKFGVSVPVTNAGNNLYAYYSACVNKCPKEGTTDMKWLANTQYPSTNYELKSWDYDTEVLAGFCIPDLEKSPYKK